MFHVRTIYLDQLREERASYELAPTVEDGQRICSLFAEFLSQRPPEFREKLPFLQRDLELEWTAGPGGVALASFHTATAPCSMGILLAGVDAEADLIMLDAWRKTVMRPLLQDDADKFLDGEERPLLVNIVFPEAPELTPALQLMAAALASVYFRCAMQFHAAESTSPSGS
jgi:hypothetical protein